MIASQPHQPAIATSTQNQRSSFHPQTSDRHVTDADGVVNLVDILDEALVDRFY